jgi:hypothetical protein
MPPVYSYNHTAFTGFTASPRQIVSKLDSYACGRSIASKLPPTGGRTQTASARRAWEQSEVTTAAMGCEAALKKMPPVYSYSPSAFTGSAAGPRQIVSKLDSYAFGRSIASKLPPTGGTRKPNGSPPQN